MKNLFEDFSDKSFMAIGMMGGVASVIFLGSIIVQLFKVTEFLILFIVFAIFYLIAHVIHKRM